MVTAGLDWSMSCPAICIYDSRQKFEFKNCTFFFYVDKKKYDQSYGNIHGFKTELYDGELDRFDKISEWGLQILLKHNVKQVCLEGYSMGSLKILVFSSIKCGSMALSLSLPHLQQSRSISREKVTRIKMQCTMHYNYSTLT